MNCRTAAERLVECARQRGAPDAFLRAHLIACDACRERWAAERDLTVSLQWMRVRAARQRSSRQSREALMEKFSATHRTAPPVRWLWAVAAAAVILFGAVLFRDVTLKPHGPEFPAPLASVSGPAEEQADPDAEGFMAVPYVPPLAPGELVRVVHRQLQPTELLSLGVNVDPTLTSELPADLLLGADGFPRAVRVSDDYSGSGGF